MDTAEFNPVSREALRRWVCLALLLLSVWGGVACTPALNWRQVQLEDLQVLLPCKPDQGERQVVLAEVQLSMQMLGCEADGGMFAISRVKAASASQAQQVQEAWQAQAFALMHVDGVEAHAWNAPGWAQHSVSVLAHGHRADGVALQARMVWMQRGERLYHLVVYAARVEDSMTEPLLSQVRSL